MDDLSRVRFLVDQVLEDVGCLYLSLWQLREDGKWHELVVTGSVMPVEEYVSDWQTFNRNVICHPRPTHTPLTASHSLTSVRLQVEGTECLIHAAHTHPNEVLVENRMALLGRLFLLFKHRAENVNAIETLGLSTRQSEVLQLMADGLTYGAIAKKLGFSESLIKQEAMRICERIGVDSRFQAVAWLRKQHNS